MSLETVEPFAVLRFEGKRFERHGLDVQCTQELVAYRRLVLECAKQLWYRENPGAALPEEFGEGFRLTFDRIEPGSAIIPVHRVHENARVVVAMEDRFDRAAALIDDALRAADSDERLPPEFSKLLVPLFRQFGQSLLPDEILFIKARRSAMAVPYSSRARDRLFDKIADEDPGPPLWERLVAIGEAEARRWAPAPGDLSMRAEDELDDDECEGDR